MGRPARMILAGSLAGFAVTAQAHHSWGAVYDGGQSVNGLAATIAGEYTRRPHDAIEVTITNSLGEPETWTVQWRGNRGGGGMGRNAAQYDFNIGDEVVIDGRMARDESQKLIQMSSLVRPSDGWTVTASLGRGGR